MNRSSADDSTGQTFHNGSPCWRIAKLIPTRNVHARGTEINN
jgi:hypothetical protein